MPNMPDLSKYTDEKLADLELALTQEKEDRALAAQAEAAVARMNDAYARVADREDPTPKDKIGKRIGPNKKIVWDDGKTYQNITGGWLNADQNPSTFPAGFKAL